jgi:C4-dicarboxylate-specific signal transduction histidine kinase
MISVFSLPLFAVWTLSDPATPPRIRSFRLVFTLSAVLLMGLMVFVRQAFLDGELRRRLLQSRESLANLKRLQAQITESEKLASIGQLVGGAAHELNNPIAAMLGYSDLLISTPLGGDQLALASRIGQEVRRTRSLVASLLSFAKPGPSALASVNLVTLLCTAVRLSQPRWKSLKVAVDTDFQPNMPQIMGDSNQLLQICMQLLNSAMNAIDHQNSRRLTVTCEHKAGLALIHIFDSTRTTYSLASQLGTQSGEAPRVSTLDALSSLGLSPCQGILRQYQGNIFARLDERYGLAIRVELPVTPPRLEKSPAAALPAVWQPQPYA